jgi:AAA-like domain
MRFPLRHLSGNVVWTHSGAVWAVWRVTPVTYPYLATGQKLAEYARTRQALVALGRAETMLLSVCAPIPAADVVERMVAGAALTDAGRRAAAATLDGLERLDLYQRVYYLAATLPDARRGAAAAVMAAAGGVGQAFGLVPPPVTAAEAGTRHRQAGEVEAKLSRYLAVEAVAPEEILWLYARAPRRGLDEPGLAEFTAARRWSERVHDAGPEAVRRGPSLAAYDNHVLYEGGLPVPGGRRGLRRRYLAVEVEVGGQPALGHQALLAFSAIPEEFTVPGTEWFAAADGLGFPVDWCARLRTVDNRVAQRRARRQARELAAQVEEYAEDPAGPPGGLARAYDNVSAEADALEANRNEHELETTLVFAVWHPDPDTCGARAEQLRDALGVDEFSLDRPTGGQRGLWWAMLLGAEVTAVCRDYTQNLLPAALAGAVPFAGAEVGDPTGLLLGFSRDGSTARPVLLDPAYGPTRLNRSGNTLLQGTLGGGKSYAMKRIGADLVGRGGRLVIVDRTPVGEWVSFAHAVAVRPAVIRIDRATDYCLDPLRVFPPAAAGRYAAGYLALLTGARPRELDGLALKRAVQAAADTGAGLAAVVEHLQHAGRTDPFAAELAAKLAYLRGDPYAAVAFGAGQPLSLTDADLVVFHCPGLTLPDQAALASDYQRAHLSDEQVHSQALLYLLAATARHIAFSDLRRFTAVLLDEAWVLAGSPEGRALLTEMLRDSRKHLSALLLSSQSIETFPAELLALLGPVLVFRQDRVAADRALAALGLPADIGLAEAVADFDTGEALFRDVRGRIGRIQVAPAALPAHRAAFNTTPTAQAATPPRDQSSGKAHR